MPTSAGEVAGSSAGTVVTCGAGAGGVYGSYAQLVASTDYDSFGLIVWSAANLSYSQYQIAVGGAGSEVNIAHIPGAGSIGAGIAMFVPVFVPAGSRLSARTASASSSQSTWISCSLIRANSNVPLASYGRLLGYSGTSVPPIVDCGAAANTKGAYTQIVASTTNDAKGFSMLVAANQLNANDQDYLLDLAVGAAASERIILNNSYWRGAAYREIAAVIGPIWTPIPAGSRIAARGQCNRTGANDRVPRVSVVLWE